LWDENDPTLKTIDENPLIGKRYAIRYPSFQFPLEKKIRISLRAFSGDALSCSKTLTKEITIYASPKVSFNPLPSICLNAAARQILETNFDTRVPGGFVYKGNGVNAGGSFDPAKAGNGDHIIQYVYTAANTGCRDSATQKITVWPLPTADFSIGNLLCEKNKTSLSSLSVANGGQINQLIWNYGDGSKPDTLSAVSAEHAYSKWGSYSISLKVKNSNGCYSDPKPKAVEIKPLPSVSFNLPKSMFTRSKSLVHQQQQHC